MSIHMCKHVCAWFCMYTCILHLYGYLWCICVRVHRCHFAYLCMFYLFMSMPLHSLVCIYKFLQMLFIHLCVHISVWIHKCVSMPMCIYMHVFVSLCVIICVSMFVSEHLCICVFECVCGLYMHYVFVRVCTYSHSHVSLYVCRCVLLHVCFCLYECLCVRGSPLSILLNFEAWLDQ